MSYQMCRGKEAQHSCLQVQTSHCQLSMRALYVLPPPLTLPIPDQSLNPGLEQLNWEQLNVVTDVYSNFHQ